MISTCRINPKTAGPILLVVGVGVLLRLWNIADESAWLDEVYTLPHLDAPSLGQFWREMAEADPPTVLAPGYFTLLYLWTRVFGATLLAARAFSLLWGIACIPLLFLLGRRLNGPQGGLLAAACCALALPHIYYAQEVRMYAMVGCLSLVSMLTLLYAMETKGRWGWLLINAGVNVLLVFSSLFSVALLLAQGFFVVVQAGRKAWWGLAVVWGTLQIAASALIMIWFRTHAVESAYWMQTPGWRELANTYLVFSGGRYSNENPAEFLALGLSLDLILSVLLYGAAVLGLARETGSPQEASPSPSHASSRARRVLLLAWLVIPPLLLFTVAVLWKPCFLYRYVLFSSFALYLLADGFLARLESPKRRRALTGLVLLLFAYQCTAIAAGPFRPDYRAALDHIGEAEARGAPPTRTPLLILKQPLNTLPLEYLDAARDRDLHIVHGIGDLHAESLRLIQEYGALWVICWRWDRLGEYQAFLRESSVRFSQFRLGGMPPLYLGLLDTPDN